MKIIDSIKKKIAIRLQYLKQKRFQKLNAKAVIKKFNLNDPAETQKIIDQFILMQGNKRVFGRKTQEQIRDKIDFMIHHNLINVVE